MQKTLYEELQNTERVVEELKNTYDSMQKLIAFRKTLGVINDPLKNSLSSFEKDVADGQKVSQIKLIEKYRENLILNSALNRVQSIEDTVLELDNDMKGIKRYLPRRKNQAYNERVEQLGELITGANYLRRRGIFVPDNLIAAGALSAAVAYAVLELFFSFCSSHFTPESFERTKLIFPYYEYAGVSLSGLIMGSNAYGNKTSGRKNTIKKAQYLDNKIKELF